MPVSTTVITRCTLCDHDDRRRMTIVPKIEHAPMVDEAFLVYDEQDKLLCCTECGCPHFQTVGLA